MCWFAKFYIINVHVRHEFDVIDFAVHAKAAYAVTRTSFANQKEDNKCRMHFHSQPLWKTINLTSNLCRLISYW